MPPISQMHNEPDSIFRQSDFFAVSGANLAPFPASGVSDCQTDRQVDEFDRSYFTSDSEV